LRKLAFDRRGKKRGKKNWPEEERRGDDIAITTTRLCTFIFEAGKKGEVRKGEGGKRTGGG